jgi:hypothetical protein
MTASLKYLDYIPMFFVCSAQFAEQPMPSQPDPSCHLNLTTLAVMVRTALDALPVSPDSPAEDIASQQQAALCAIAAFAPRDPVEAMLAARATVTHHAIMECFRRAMLPDVGDALAIRLRNNALALSRLFTTTLRELEQMQAGPARPVPATSDTSRRDPPPPQTPPPATSQASAMKPPAAPRPAILAPTRPEDLLQAKIVAELIERTHTSVAATAIGGMPRAA